MEKAEEGGRVYIKLYGERNTNTNHLSQLIALNLDVEQLPGVVPDWVAAVPRWVPGNGRLRDAWFRATDHRNLGWKHRAAEPASTLADHRLVLGGTAIVTLTKNPYSWLLSLARRPYQHSSGAAATDFVGFLQTPWATLGRDGLEKIVTDPVELWNAKNASYRQLAGVGALNLNTEDLFVDPQVVVDRIADHFALARTESYFTDYVRSTKGGADLGRDSSYYRDFYLHERWRSQLTSVAIELINDRLDHDLCRSFGYVPLNPADAPSTTGSAASEPGATGS